MVASYYVGFNRKKARTAALELVKSRQSLDFIYACSTDIALGIADALAETGKTGKILLNGWGGGSAELEMIRKETLNFTVMRMNDDSSVAIAEAIKLDISGKATEVPHIYSGDIILIDKQTDETQIQKLKNRAFRYSGEGRLN